jgi:hypothetical protein
MVRTGSAPPATRRPARAKKGKKGKKGGKASPKGGKAKAGKGKEKKGKKGKKGKGKKKAAVEVEAPVVEAAKDEENAVPETVEYVHVPAEKPHIFKGSTLFRTFQLNDDALVDTRHRLHRRCDAPDKELDTLHTIDGHFVDPMQTGASWMNIEGSTFKVRAGVDPRHIFPDITETNLFGFKVAAAGSLDPDAQTGEGEGAGAGGGSRAGSREGSSRGGGVDGIDGPGLRPASSGSSGSWGGGRGGGGGRGKGKEAEVQTPWAEMPYRMHDTKAMADFRRPRYLLDYNSTCSSPALPPLDPLGGEGGGDGGGGETGEKVVVHPAGVTRVLRGVTTHISGEEREATRLEFTRFKVPPPPGEEGGGKAGVDGEEGEDPADAGEADD